MHGVVVVHGGAGKFEPERIDPAKEGCSSAAAAGAAELGDGALAAAVAAVKVLEADPTFNAGYGATLTSDGTVELDAAVMTGDLRFGSVGCCPPVASAIELAVKVMEEGVHSLLVAHGAVAMAESSGVALLGPDDLITDRARRRLETVKAAETRGDHVFGSPETVGAVAVDSDGNLAAATSTGGIINKQPGRIGDTPMPGGGTYADDELGAAASATGHGEMILRVLLCREAVQAIANHHTAEGAVKLALEKLGVRLKGRGGLILVTKKGEFFAGKNTQHMPWAACRPGETPASGI